MPRLSDWVVPVGLLLLSLVPVLAGTVRLLQIVSGDLTAENARFLDAPLPGVLHITAVTLFSLLGAFQFAPSLRRRLPRWHRRSGRLVVPAGLVAALSGLWMSQFYALPPTDGLWLYAIRWVVGVWMIFALIRGYLAIRARKIAQHRAWMIRGYAIGMGAGTQVLTSVPYFVLVGQPDTGMRALLLGLGWAINAVVAELILARGAGRRQPVANTG